MPLRPTMAFAGAIIEASKIYLRMLAVVERQV
jgi:hypothetical protein